MLKLNSDLVRCIFSGMVGALMASSFSLVGKAESGQGPDLKAHKIEAESIILRDKNGDPVCCLTAGGNGQHWH